MGDFSGWFSTIISTLTPFIMRLRGRLIVLTHSVVIITMAGSFHEVRIIGVYQI